MKKNSKYVEYIQVGRHALFSIINRTNLLSERQRVCVNIPDRSYLLLLSVSQLIDESVVVYNEIRIRFPRLETYNVETNTSRLGQAKDKRFHNILIPQENIVVFHRFFEEQDPQFDIAFIRIPESELEFLSKNCHSINIRKDADISWYQKFGLTLDVRGYPFDHNKSYELFHSGKNQY